ncbi:MAG: hypothetical protein WAL84_05990 [Candidatus Dormiibacterota bacterium]
MSSSVRPDIGELNIPTAAWGPVGCIGAGVVVVRVKDLRRSSHVFIVIADGIAL